MMRVQYESLVKRIFAACDDELELETREGSDVFRCLMVALFQHHPSVKKAKRGELNEMPSLPSPDVKQLVQTAMKGIE